MNKAELVYRYKTFLHRHGLKPEEVVVGAGGAMLVHGLRKETADIDADISPELFRSFDGVYPVNPGKSWQRNCSELLLDLHDNRGIQGPTIIIDGVCVDTLESILAFKRQLNRNKDQADIAVLEKILNKGEVK